MSGSSVHALSPHPDERYRRVSKDVFVTLGASWAILRDAAPRLLRVSARKSPGGMS